MRSFDEPILQMARHVADIKRGRNSIEEKAEAIGSFVTNFFLEARTVRGIVAPLLRPQAKQLDVLHRKKSRPPIKPMPAPPFVEEAVELRCPAAAAPSPPPIIRISPPIIVKHLAAELGIQPNQLIAELMTFNIFVNINQTIEPDIASKICENHGFVLKKERREKGLAVHKVEQVVIAPSPCVIEEAATMTSLEEVMHKLHADTVLFLHTADTLAAALREYDLDWSPAVIMLCTRRAEVLAGNAVLSTARRDRMVGDGKPQVHKNCYHQRTGVPHRIRAQQ